MDSSGEVMSCHVMSCQPVAGGKAHSELDSQSIYIVLLPLKDVGRSAMQKKEIGSRFLT
jgi:hypothetical protein